MFVVILFKWYMLDFINHKYIFRGYTMMVVFNLYYIKEKPVMSG